MNFPIETKRHSLSHVLTQAVESIYGKENIRLGFGPEIENGFYQDFDFADIKVSDEDLKSIEKKMKNILAQNQIFESYELPIDQAIAKYKGKDEYRVENIEKLKQQGETKINFYRNLDQKGEEKFENLCTGPHVEKLSQIDKNAFFLDKIAGAYWLGDEKKPMLTRIYGVAFDSREELDVYKKMVAEAKKRDHRVLGKKLELFTFSDRVGSGLPLFLPSGEIIKFELERYMREEKEKLGYSFVSIPHIAKRELYEKSGHMGKYDAMMPTMTDKEGNEFVLRAMNCPHHFELYNATQHSYKQLPFRYAENTTCYRNEKTGELSGLTRVKGLTQDDTHHFVRHTQIADEIKMILGLMERVYKTFDFGDFKVEISVRDMDNLDQYFGDDEVWSKAESTLIEMVKDWGVEYSIEEGEAAFYGPKIDIKVQDAIGRDWQLTTVQLDFIQPENFDMTYTNEKGEDERPAILHVAILGSSHRFMGVLIEHFAGTFPLWLAPRQAIVVPVGEKFEEYAREVEASLKQAGVRVSGDYSSDGLNKKVRNAEKMHINYILVVGEAEATAKTVAVRDYRTKEQTVEKLNKFQARIIEEYKTRKL